MSTGVKRKRSLLEKKYKTNLEYGRMKYSGIDMAFIYIRGKRMLTMSEVSRKLYPQWPRTTLSDRMKQLNIQRHVCTPREIEKVYSVNGVVKQGIHCTLVSKEDLDVFCNAYKSNAFKLVPIASKGRNSTSAIPNNLAELGGELIDVGTGTKQASRWRPKQNKDRNLKKTASSLAKRKKNVLAANKQSQTKVKIVKSGTRVVKGLKAGKALGHKRHVALTINKAIGKQLHVVETSRSHGITAGQLSNSRLNGIRKRKHSATGKETENATAKYRRQSETKKQRKRRDTSSPASDCTSFDSGISSLSLILDPPGRRSKTTISKINKKEVSKTKTKNKNGLITKNVNLKVKCNGMKIQNGKFKNTTSGLKRKGEKMSNKTKSGKETGHKKAKMSKINKTGSNKITKEFIMKMDLKHMNDNDLINSISPLSSSLSSSDNTPHSEDSSYLIKLMPVKPVWKVNSNFRFISNFVLPPSLVVRDGELRPACSMVCNHGLRPPSAHPIWKWKIGEPVIGNKTEISYCVKKVKCI